MEENEELKSKRILIEFENELIDYFLIKRIEKVEEYDAESNEGLKFGVKIMLDSFPTDDRLFWYKTVKLRNSGYSVLKDKLRYVDTLII